MSLNILVTGGAGFIGSNYIRQVIQTHPSDRIINLDKLTYSGNLENLREVADHDRYEFVHGDIADEDTVKPLVKRVDAVVNFAAESHVDRSIRAPKVFRWSAHVAGGSARGGHRAIPPGEHRRGLR